MKTYIIFFGKSQNFIFHAFNASSYIENFDSVIKGFDLLESQHFTVDDVNNKEILAKYNFKSSDNKKFSLIKLYSLAQAFGGDRIAGSTYGVALLSESELSFSKDNFDLLKAAKENFAKLSLNGLKFNKSDFKDDAFSIWKAIIDFKDGNYFNKITTNGNPNISNTTTIKSFFVHSLFEDTLRLNNELNNVARAYFSEDFEHLKRTNKKWGDAIFPIFLKEKGVFTIYKEIKPKPDTQYQVDDVNNDSAIINLLKEQNIKIDKLKTHFRLLTICSSIFGFITIAFFIKSNLVNNKESDVEINQTNTSKLSESTKIKTVVAPTSSQKVKLPFPTWVNQNESNEFRKYVNDSHMEYAKSNDLEITGSFDNPTMRKAWDEYGSEFRDFQKKSGN